MINYAQKHNWPTKVGCQCFNIRNNYMQWCLTSLVGVGWGKKKIKKESIHLKGVRVVFKELAYLTSLHLHTIGG